MNVVIPQPTQRLNPTANLAVDVVLFTLRPGVVDEAWQVLLVRRSQPGDEKRWGLPGVLVREDETFDEAARRALLVKAGLDANDWYLEQLATFGDPGRDSRGRVASVAHIVLVRHDDLIFHQVGDGSSPEWWPVSQLPWEELVFDHAEVLKVAVNRVRSKIRYAWVLFQLLPPVFTMSELRAAYAAIRDPEVMHLSTSNVRKLFRSLIESGALVSVGERAEAQGRGRPGDLFRFDGPLTGTWSRELPW
jgi:8-oxo-dGTP diphosphatase